jgi:hypothetical protein
MLTSMCRRECDLLRVRWLSNNGIILLDIVAGQCVVTGEAPFVIWGFAQEWRCSRVSNDHAHMFLRCKSVASQYLSDTLEVHTVLLIGCTQEVCGVACGEEFRELPACSDPRSLAQQGPTRVPLMHGTTTSSRTSASRSFGYYGEPFLLRHRQSFRSTAHPHVTALLWAIVVMRLLNTRTMKLESYFNNIPPYAILSHCWEEGVR